MRSYGVVYDHANASLYWRTSVNQNMQRVQLRDVLQAGKGYERARRRSGHAQLSVRSLVPEQYYYSFTQKLVAFGHSCRLCCVSNVFLLGTLENNFNSFSSTQ